MKEDKKKVYIKNFGWQMGAVLQDYAGVSEGAF